MKTKFVIQSEDEPINVTRWRNGIDVESNHEWLYIKIIRDDGKEAFIQIEAHRSGKWDGITIFVQDTVHGTGEEEFCDERFWISWNKIPQKENIGGT